MKTFLHLIIWSIFLVCQKITAGQSVVLAWDPNPESDNIVKYTIHMGSVSGSYSKNINTRLKTRLVIGNLSENEHHYFAVSSSNAIETSLPSAAIYVFFRPTQPQAQRQALSVEIEYETIVSLTHAEYRNNVAKYAPEPPPPPHEIESDPNVRQMTFEFLIPESMAPLPNFTYYFEVMMSTDLENWVNYQNKSVDYVYEENNPRKAAVFKTAVNIRDYPQIFFRLKYDPINHPAY